MENGLSLEAERGLVTRAVGLVQRGSSGLVIGVTDLVQRGEDMKSGLARPLENYFCLGFNFQNTRSTSKNLQARLEKCSNHSGA